MYLLHGAAFPFFWYGGGTMSDETRFALFVFVAGFWIVAAILAVFFVDDSGQWKHKRRDDPTSRHDSQS